MLQDKRAKKRPITWLLVHRMAPILSFRLISSRFPTSLKKYLFHSLIAKWYNLLKIFTGSSRTNFVTAIERNSAFVLLGSLPTLCFTGFRAGRALKAKTGSETTKKREKLVHDQKKNKIKSLRLLLFRTSILSTASLGGSSHRAISFATNGRKSLPKASLGEFGIHSLNSSSSFKKLPNLRIAQYPVYRCF